MITSPDSPPVQTCQDSTELITITSPNLNYNRSIRRIDKAVKKIHKLNDNTAKCNNPQVLFLDADNNQQNEERVVNFQQEQEKLEREQANLISIIPAPQKSETTEQDNTKNTSTENNKQVSQEPTGKDTEEPTTLDTRINNNDNIADQLVDKHDTKAQDNNNQEEQHPGKNDIPRILHTPIFPSQWDIGHKLSRSRSTKWNTVTQCFILERRKCDTRVSSVKELETKL